MFSADQNCASEIMNVAVPNFQQHTHSLSHPSSPVVVKFRVS